MLFRSIVQGELRFTVDKSSIAVPDLGSAEWKFADSLPEVQDGFDDSGWILADHTTTNITRPIGGDGRVLYGTSSPIIVVSSLADSIMQDATTDCEYPHDESNKRRVKLTE